MDLRHIHIGCQLLAQFLQVRPIGLGAGIDLPVLMGAAVQRDLVSFRHSALQNGQMVPIVLCRNDKKGRVDPFLLQNIQHRFGGGTGAVVKGQIDPLRLGLPVRLGLYGLHRPGVCRRRFQVLLCAALHGGNAPCPHHPCQHQAADTPQGRYNVPLCLHRTFHFVPSCPPGRFLDFLPPSIYTYSYDIDRRLIPADRRKTWKLQRCFWPRWRAC